MDNVVELHPHKRTEERIKRTIRETIEGVVLDEEEQEKLEDIIFKLYEEWYHNAPDLKVEYIEGTFTEVVRQIEGFYQGIVQNLLCALAAEKFALYKAKKYAQPKNNNNKNS